MLATVVYRLAVVLGVPIASLMLRRPDLRRAHRGRLDAVRQLGSWASINRDLRRPLVWFHAASVGEGLQARAVIAELRRIAPQLQIVATRFSASAERIAESMGADFSGYLPYDRVEDARRALDVLRPTLLVFSKLDVWPELAVQSASAGAKVVLVAGSVDPGSARLRRSTQLFTHRGYAAIDLAGVISEQDGARLHQLGTPYQRIVVTGDPRVDSVLEAVQQLRPEWPAHPDPQLLVAGSTWPEDEAVLLDALTSVRKSHPGARLLIVPHEPSQERVAGIELRARGLGLECARWDRDSDATTAVLYVDRLGILAGLYSLGSVAYVGGGFGKRGIHSVLEPAAWGAPVIIGPNDRGVRDAQILAEAGGLLRLSGKQPAGALSEAWRRWLDPASRLAAGRAALGAITAERGAARRNAELLVRLL